MRVEDPKKYQHRSQRKMVFAFNKQTQSDQTYEKETLSEKQGLLNDLRFFCSFWLIPSNYCYLSSSIFRTAWHSIFYSNKQFGVFFFRVITYSFGLTALRRMPRTQFASSDSWTPKNRLLARAQKPGRFLNLCRFSPNVLSIEFRVADCRSQVEGNKFATAVPEVLAQPGWFLCLFWHWTFISFIHRIIWTTRAVFSCEPFGFESISHFATRRFFAHYMQKFAATRPSQIELSSPRLINPSHIELQLWCTPDCCNQLRRWLGKQL